MVYGLQCIVGLILLLAAGSKVLDPGSLSEVFDWLAWSEVREVLTLYGLVFLESCLGVLLLQRRPGAGLLVAAGALVTIFTGFLAAMLISADPPKCGCIALVATFNDARHEASLGIVRNVFMLAVLALSLRRSLRGRRMCDRSLPFQFSSDMGSGAVRQRGFSVVELLVVCGVLTILVGLIAPAILSGIRRSQTVQCASNLSQIDRALRLYSLANDDYTPRGSLSHWARSDFIHWARLIGPMLRVSFAIDSSNARHVRVLQCPAHPVADAATGYNQNGLAVEPDSPGFGADPEGVFISGPVKRTQIRKPSTLLYLVDSPDWLNTGQPRDSREPDLIFAVSRRNLAGVRTLVTGDVQRIAESRHGRFRVNALMFDGSVQLIDPRTVTVESLDDGIRNRRFLWDLPIWAWPQNNGVWEVPLDE